MKTQALFAICASLVICQASFAAGTPKVTVTGAMAESLYTLIEKAAGTKEMPIVGIEPGGFKQVNGNFICFREVEPRRSGSVAYETHCEVGKLAATEFEISADKAKVILLNGDPAAKVLLDIMKSKSIPGVEGNGVIRYKTDFATCTEFLGSAPFLPGVACTLSQVR
jgi:hypothetical protein